MKSCADILNEHLAARQRRNPGYSLRAYSRDLQIHPGTLSSVLSNKRALPTKLAPKIAERLGLTPKLRQQFFRSIEQSHSRLSALLAEPAHKSYELDETHFHIIAEWEHYAVLSLMEIKNFDSDPAWIAGRLNISTPRAKAVLQRLEDAHLITRDKDNKWKLVHASIDAPDGVTTPALRAAHKEELALAQKAVDDVALELRDITSTTLTLNPKNIGIAKQALRRFRSELMTLVEADDASEVYQFCMQLFPLTNVQDNKGNNP